MMLAYQHWDLSFEGVLSWLMLAAIVYGLTWLVRKLKATELKWRRNRNKRNWGRMGEAEAPQEEEEEELEASASPAANRSEERAAGGLDRQVKMILFIVVFVGACVTVLLTLLIINAGKPRYRVAGPHNDCVLDTRTGRMYYGGVRDVAKKDNVQAPPLQARETKPQAAACNASAGEAQSNGNSGQQRRGYTLEELNALSPPRGYTLEELNAGAGSLPQ